jgi:hypothetical protein
VKHARYYWLLLAEGHLNRRRFAVVLGRIALLPVPAGPAETRGRQAVPLQPDRRIGARRSVEDLAPTGQANEAQANGLGLDYALFSLQP